MKKMKLKYLFLLIILMLSGCGGGQEHKIIFNDEDIEVGSNIDVCKLILKIDDVEIKPKNIANNKIKLDNGKTLKCINVPTDKVGNYEVSYDYDYQIIKHIFKVVDTQKPTITAKEILEVEAGNKYFDINKEVSIADNADSDFFKSIEGNINLNKPGTYEVLIKAKDKSGNKAEKKIKVKVIPKEKETVTKIINNYIDTGSNISNDNYYHDTDNNNNYSNNISTSTIKPFINGVHDITIAKGSSLNDLIASLTDGVSSSAALSINYAEVNLSSKGTYIVYFNGSDGTRDNCTVTVN